MFVQARLVYHCQIENCSTCFVQLPKELQSPCHQQLTFVNTCSSLVYEKQLVKLKTECYLQIQL